MAKESTGYRVLATVGAAVGAVVARKVLITSWKTATGKEPPAHPENPDVRWAEAATWAVASAVVVALAKLTAQRRVAATWRHASGELPPAVEDRDG
ncbi:MAG TPA: DUF4235 domain-containing protein [Mycobacteriales bacterium]|nr:DUF4235 domain-containing protein [Mycobacteriales bacterium]